MKNVLALLLSLVVVFGCDDKKEEPCDCAPVAGEMMDMDVQDAGEQVDAGEEVEAGAEEEVDMDQPEAGDMSEDMEPDAEEPCCEGEGCEC